MLISADAIMVLSTADNCLLCGAYEAVGAGKPLILSETKVLFNYFNQGAIYTKNTVQEIAEGIKNMVKEKNSLEQGIIALKNSRSKEWSEQWAKLNALIVNNN